MLLPWLTGGDWPRQPVLVGWPGTIEYALSKQVPLPPAAGGRGRAGQGQGKGRGRGRGRAGAGAEAGALPLQLVHGGGDSAGVELALCFTPGGRVSGSS